MHFSSEAGSRVFTRKHFAHPKYLEPQVFRTKQNKNRPGHWARPFGKRVPASPSQCSAPRPQRVDRSGRTVAFRTTSTIRLDLRFPDLQVFFTNENYSHLHLKLFKKSYRPIFLFWFEREKEVCLTAPGGGGYWAG